MDTCRKERKGRKSDRCLCCCKCRDMKRLIGCRKTKGLQSSLASLEQHPSDSYLEKTDRSGRLRSLDRTRPPQAYPFSYRLQLNFVSTLLRRLIRSFQQSYR